MTFVKRDTTYVHTCVRMHWPRYGLGLAALRSAMIHMYVLTYEKDILWH